MNTLLGYKGGYSSYQKINKGGYSSIIINERMHSITFVNSLSKIDDVHVK